MIKTLIYRIIGPTTFFRIKRVFNKIRSRKPNCSSNRKMSVYSKGYHTTCGYYDLDPEQNGKLLYGCANRDMTSYDIVLQDLRDGSINIIDTTFAVNWQQGCRLKWIGKAVFFYNVFDGSAYHSIVVNDGKKTTHHLPIYDADEKYGVSLDFVRLGHMRPGYGYTLLPKNSISEESIAITIFNMLDDKILRKITYADIIKASGLNPVLQNCYVNHVSISPNGEQFLFFFVEIQGSRHMCYLMVYREGRILLLEDHLSASHYTWMSNKEILVTAYDDKHQCRYYIYNTEQLNKIPFLGETLIQDGHPTRINEEQIITDTYPDTAGFQYIKLINIETGSIETLVSAYSTAKHIGEQRCDLHPRYSHALNSIFFDADVDGHRRLYEIKLGEKK